jgi:DNA-binding MarR family transcriptional regulator
MNDSVLEKIAGLDQTVHNPARLMIIWLLTRYDNLGYLELMERTSLTSGNITTHLAKLAAGGYVSIQKSFKGNKPNTSLALTEAGRTAFSRWGETIASVLPESLIQQVNDRLPNPMNEQKTRHLINGDVFFQEKRYFASLPEHLIRGYDLPPVQMPGCI